MLSLEKCRERVILQVKSLPVSQRKKLFRNDPGKCKLEEIGDDNNC